jgi:hypothetical protein
MIFTVADLPSKHPEHVLALDSRRHRFEALRRGPKAMYVTETVKIQVKYTIFLVTQLDPVCFIVQCSTFSPLHLTDVTRSRS